jgi:preprotein translocase subunit SecD
MNQYPIWKYLLILVLVCMGTLYALPNLYGEDPAVQISPNSHEVEIDTELLKRIEGVLEEHKITHVGLSQQPRRLLIRFTNTEVQLQAKDILKDALGRNYVVALNLAPATPEWLSSINALPMYLGLDLRGGVHFLIEVDTEEAVKKAEERYVSDLRSLFRGEKVRYITIVRRTGTDTLPSGVEIKFRDADTRDKAVVAVRKEYPDLQLEQIESGDDFLLLASLSDREKQETRRFAVKQNITTLRSRVNELGVAEPIIQQQGVNRIVVQLPGVQDTARAKGILGTAATLEYHMVDTEHDLQEALGGRVPAGSKIYHERNGRPILLLKRIIVTGDQIIDASSGFDQQSGSPAVFVSLDGKGAHKMLQTTQENTGKPMAVVFIETITETKEIDGKRQRVSKRVEEVISVATIRGVFSKRFQTTGLNSSEEARNLALLLRAGALAAPIEIVEERTIGPSLGQDNIDQGFRSVIIGFVLVLGFMAFWYRGFGLVANLALFMNLVLIVAVLSMLQATLTLPGIAGIVLTVGMAVDANVLIFERIREELRNRNTPQSSIFSGYEKALSTIADANITTLIASIVLFSFGTGPIKGFAITLSIGILTSMFTAIMGTRAVVNLVYGSRRLTRLSI